jgi:recombination protein RecA
VEIRRASSIKEGDLVVGNRTRVKIVKNKVAPPFREAEFDIIYNQGISYEGDLLDQAVEKRIVDKSGSWFSYKGERMGQGRDNAKQFLREHPDATKEIDAKLREVLALHNSAASVAEKANPGAADAAE